MLIGVFALNTVAFDLADYMPIAISLSSIFNSEAHILRTHFIQLIRRFDEHLSIKVILHQNSSKLYRIVEYSYQTKELLLRLSHGICYAIVCTCSLFIREYRVYLSVYNTHIQQIQAIRHYFFHHTYFVHKMIFLSIKKVMFSCRFK